MLNDVVMKRDQLMQTLALNRQKHVEAFQIALAGFKEEYGDRLHAMLEQAKAGKYPQSVNVPEPESHEKEYKRAESMLAHDQREIIELDQQTFRQLVLDEWEWSDRWTASNSPYITKMSARK